MEFSFIQTLPNLMFSTALAYHLKSKKKDSDTKSRTSATADSTKNLANEKLQEALLLFPNFMSPLFEACKIEPDAEFKKCNYFNYAPTERKQVPEAVNVLVRLYVARTNMIWKTKDAMIWLENNATDLSRRITSGELKPEDPNTYWTTVFKTSAPRNLLRHLILSPDLPSEIVSVPPSAAATPILDIDPFPPQNQILSYKRPPRPANESFLRLTRDTPQSALRLFFRSMIPDFETNAGTGELDAETDNLARELNEGASGDEDSTLQRSVNGLMDSLRGLLAAVQADGDEEDDDDEDIDDELD